MPVPTETPTAKAPKKPRETKGGIPAAVVSIMAMPVIKARETIEECTSIKTLRELLNYEERAGIVERARGRIAALEQEALTTAKPRRMPVEPTTPAPDAARAKVRKARGFGKVTDTTATATETAVSDAAPPTPDATPADTSADPTTPTAAPETTTVHDAAVAAVEAAMAVAEAKVTARVGKRLGKPAQKLIEEPTEMDDGDDDAGSEDAVVTRTHGAGTGTTRAAVPSLASASTPDTIWTCPKCGAQGEVGILFGYRKMHGVLHRQSQCRKCRAAASRIAAKKHTVRAPVAAKGFGKKKKASAPAPKRTFGKKKGGK